MAYKGKYKGSEIDFLLGKANNSMSKSEVNSAIETKIKGIKIPTKVSELDNDKNYLTEHQSLEGYVKDKNLAKVAKSGSYNDLNDKPTIPNAVTENVVTNWGFTKNKGTVTNIKINGFIKSPDINGIVDLGTIEGSSDESQFINYDLNVKAINHRGYSSQSPENTIPAYIMSKQKGFTYVEGDVSFTKDSVAVLLHDATINRTSNGSGDVTKFLYQELLQYDFGSWFSKEYAGVKIPTFKEWIICCKNLGLHPYIELKSTGGYTQTQINQVVNEVEECGMKGKVTYISFSDTFLGYVKNADAYARLGLLANPLNSSKISQAEALKTSTNEVFLDAKLSSVTSSLIASLMRKEMALEVWTVNTEEEILGMPSYVSGVTSDYIIAGKVLYKNALTYVPPTSSLIPTTNITLNKAQHTFNSKESITLVASVEPSNSTEEVVWKSSNNSIATVINGVVTPVADGNCTITATSGQFSAYCSISVAFTKFSITSNLTGCQLQSDSNNVVIGTSWSGEIIPNDGYSLKNASIQITMGGTNITSSAYNNGIITIENVTGNIVVNATCVQVPIYTITRNLVGCTSNKSITSIGEGNPYNEVFTALDGYTLSNASVTITMGGVNITPMYSNGTLNIAEVTGNLTINVEAVEVVGVQPIIDLSLTNVQDGKIINLGTGGSTYDATISIPSSSRDSYAVSENGLLLNNHAYANMPYGFKASDKFTIIIKTRITQKSSNIYQRVYRTDQDMPSLFYSTNAQAIGGKLAGVSHNGFTVHNDLGSVTGTGGALNTCYLSIYNEEGFDESIMHEYKYTSDGTIIKFYVDGVLIASQNASPLKTSTKIGLGDNDTSKTYYATQIEVAEFKVYNTDNIE